MEDDFMMDDEDNKLLNNQLFSQDFAAQTNTDNEHNRSADDKPMDGDREQQLDSQPMETTGKEDSQMNVDEHQLSNEEENFISSNSREIESDMKVDSKVDEKKD